MKTAFVPFFPLNVLLLPNEEMVLHIFEPRYIELINDCIKLKAKFGIPYVLKNRITDYGCEVEVIEVLKEYKTGEKDIIIRSTNIFKLITFEEILESKLYAGGKVAYELLDDKQADSALLDVFKQIQIDENGFNKKYFYGNNFSVLEIAAQSALTLEQKLKFIELPNAKKKEAFLVSQLRLLILLKSQENKLEHNFYLN